MKQLIFGNISVTTDNANESWDTLKKVITDMIETDEKISRKKRKKKPCKKEQ